jgi:hypothetical protein
MSEHQIQAAVIRWRDDMIAAGEYRLRNLFAIPNGGARDKVTGARLKAEGVRAGVPDLILAWPSMVAADPWHGLFIELKTPTGRLSVAQAACLHDLTLAGYFAIVCRSAQEAIDAIRAYLGMP